MKPRADTAAGGADLSARRAVGSAAGSSARRRAAIAPLAVLLAVVGCAYFNGVYNAKESTRKADRLNRRGRVSEASQSYALAAATAETVLARYPRTRWRPDALYLAGRGEAYSGACAEARPRLTEYLALPHEPNDRRERATVALASCAVEESSNAEARRLATPLLKSRDRLVATAAARVAARAAIALGDMPEAERLLATLPSAEAQWELAGSALERQDYARAESLLVLRGRQGDIRDALTPALQTLWAAKRYDGVERVVDAYASGRTRAASKIGLQMFVADLLIGAERDSAARAHLMRASRLAIDSLTEREINSRLTLLDLGRRASLSEVETAIRNGSARNRGSMLQRRLEDSLLLLHLLELRQDFTGASLFLAAEVARDSLRAPALAHTLFSRLVETYPQSPLAPKALIAASILRPDSAAAYQERMRTQFAASPYWLMLTGREPADSGALRRDDQLLRQTWTVVTSLFADSILKLRPAGASGPTAAAAGGAPPSAARDLSP